MENGAWREATGSTHERWHFAACNPRRSIRHLSVSGTRGAVPLDDLDRRRAATPDRNSIRWQHKPGGLAGRQSDCVLVTCQLPDCSGRRTLPAPPSQGRLQWTLDAKGIAFLPTTPSNIWVQPFDGKPAYQLTHFDGDRPIVDFGWSRDGKRLAVARQIATTDIVLLKGLKRN